MLLQEQAILATLYKKTKFIKVQSSAFKIKVCCIILSSYLTCTAVRQFYVFLKDVVYVGSAISTVI